MVNQPLLALPYCALVHVAVSILISCGGGLFPISSICYWIKFCCEILSAIINNMNLSNRCRVVVSLSCGSCFAGDFSEIAGAAVALGVAGGFLANYKCVAL